ncbi:MAG: hypothetical protein COA96_07055 [SAR86 cluster bacterium]|uniref:DUF4468 domain-containing protein n=1 Tax=SAR86 cluster bacterium TaxID=2030880 RepID=A0A2A5B1Z7_9GAMM|nr:MAG: hypothetical protein COA96_07055 [SAR86 cluster bacterium]
MHKLVGALLLVSLIMACSTSTEFGSQFGDTEKLQAAEALIDAFYSFDAKELESKLATASSSISSLVYYQGWAEGGNYKIVERKPCQFSESNVVRCPITVEDDPMLALGIDFNVTDTFEISFRDDKIASVKTSSNDMQIYYDARDWVMKEMPDLIAQPCQGFFDGGPTPGACAKAMAEGYARFSAAVNK